MPVIPDQMKERPEYREAWGRYEMQMDEWRKNLEITLSQLTSLKERIEALENADAATSEDLSTEVSKLRAQISSLQTSLTTTISSVTALEEADSEEAPATTTTSEPGFDLSFMTMGG